MDGLAGQNGADVEDTATGLGVDHLAGDPLAHQIGAAYIGVEHLVERLRAGIQKERAVDPRRVVHQHPQRPPQAADLVDHPEHICLVAEIALQRPCLPTGRGDRSAHLLGPEPIFPVVDDNSGTRSREKLCCRRPDPSRGAGHQDALAAEVKMIVRHSGFLPPFLPVCAP